MRHLVFFIGYIYFLCIDFMKKEIALSSLAVYAFFALVAMMMTKDEISMVTFVDIIYSIIFGLGIYFVSYFSKEGIGIADGLYFVINGLLLSLKENVILFFTGLFVAFIVGMFLYYFGNHRSRTDTRLPFMPCFLPAIIGYIICIV